MLIEHPVARASCRDELTVWKTVSRVSTSLQRFLYNQFIGSIERFERSGVRPPAVEDIISQLAFFNIGVINVSNFKLAAS